MAQAAVKPAATPIKEPTTSELHQQVETLKADIAKLTETITGLGKQKADATKEDLELRAALLKERGKAVADQANAEFQRIAADTERSVREKPLQALAIAAGIGLVLGFLTRK